MPSLSFKRNASLLILIPSFFALAACESTGTARIAGIASDGFTTAAEEGPKGDQGEAGPQGTSEPLRKDSDGLGLGDAGVLAIGGLVGAQGIAGTGLLASTGDLSSTNPVISGVLIKSGGLVNVVADKTLLLASAIDSKLPGGKNLVGTVVGVVKATGVALVQTGNGQQYLVDGILAAPGQLINATIGKANVIGSGNVTPLIGASILSPGQSTGSLLTVGVASNGQLITLQPAGTSGGLLGGVSNGGLVSPVTGLLPSLTNGTPTPSANGQPGIVTGVTDKVGGVLGGLTGKLKGKGN